jgi:hypothetical protein
MQVLVYKVPGPHHGPCGKTYEYRAVKSKEEFKAALKEGWFGTIMEAVGEEATKADDPSTPDVNEAYKEGKGLRGFFGKEKSEERIELEKQASELGLEYHPKLGDKKLKQLIDEKLAE